MDGEMIKRTVDEYIEKILADFDWDALRTECELDMREIDSLLEEGKVFIGTVMSLSPSGKYYTPFATGSLTEEEADEDAKWYEAFTEVALGFDMNISEGEDPCDMFLVLLRDKSDNMEE